MPPCFALHPRHAVWYLPVRDAWYRFWQDGEMTSNNFDDISSTMPRQHDTSDNMLSTMPRWHNISDNLSLMTKISPRNVVQKMLKWLRWDQEMLSFLAKYHDMSSKIDDISSFTICCCDMLSDREIQTTCCPVCHPIRDNTNKNNDNNDRCEMTSRQHG